jgi:K(+)-stimulated pyrophosphate-energized sodium pump
MNATTFDDTTTIQGAPRRMVEDAWRTLNRRYAIGAGVLVTALLLMWGMGNGPGAWRAEAPGAGGSPGSAGAPSTLSRDAGGMAGSAGTSSSGGTGSASSGASGGAAGAASGGSGGAGAASGGGGTGSAGAASNAAGSAAANGSAAGGAPAVARGGPASGNGAAASATPRALPGAPVARLFFEPDQAWPTGEVGPSLAPVLARLKAEPETRALVSGFHDRRGSAEQNAALAQRRAQVVRRVLIREGIAAERIVLARPQQTQGSGPDREARRVEVTVAR